MLKKIAHPKLLTSKPGTNFTAIATIIPLITNKKRPKLKSVIGIVKMTKIGFKKALSNPIMAATTIAVQILLTCTAGCIMYCVIITASTITTKRNNDFNGK